MSTPSGPDHERSSGSRAPADPRPFRSRFRPLASGEPDEIDLELSRLEGIAHPAIRAEVERAASGPLRDVVAEMDAYAAFFEQHAPGLPEAPAVSPAFGARWRAPLLAAALVLIAVGVTWLGLPGEPGYRAMGGLPVDIAVMRQSEQLAPPVAFEPGDQVHLGFVAPRSGIVDVFTLQDDGMVSLLLRGAPVRGGERFVLPGAARLDAYAQREWIVVELGDQVREHAAIVDSASALLPDPLAHAEEERWVLEVTRSGLPHPEERE